MCMGHDDMNSLHTNNETTQNIVVSEQRESISFSFYLMLPSERL